MNREQSQYDLNGQMREDNNNSRDFVAGAIVGGLAGALAALLLAPKSGKELRGSLNEQTSTLKNKSVDLASVAKEKASGLKETVSQQSSTIANKVKDMKNKNGNTSQNTDIDEGELQEVPTSMAETSTMENTHTATGEEIQKKLEETQKAFDDTENKLNQ
ncbi:YtxH domain-containing protein [Mesobacillus selenatarsenatis]|uniref:General stress protein n=1 Tax=Mesobacillus selenatarsenatis (strain DSM 18680 / JCM 14380 / FERM P-15431 / SF-1) TaxID=1321606 RepID=A0A0A8X0I7_MESS1|nr:YtxH domain-containing protein [Mesobacillus selenatarsenatis]GAM12759.1 general stress protein [Mesobacillus selenatarsenatis SF-1]